jgi:gliding motility-associatede transport system auxiliary component
MPRRVEQTALTPQQAQAVLAGWVGLVLLALGLVVWYATNVREWYTNALLGAGIVALLDWAIFAGPLVLGRFSPRQLAAEANATIFIICVIGIVIFLNVVASRRLGAYELDLTKNKRYTLSNFSKSIVRKFNEKVQVTAFIPKPGPFTPQYGQQRQQAQDLLTQYQSSNPQIDWRLVDPYVDRALATQKNINSWPTLLFETAGKNEKATDITEKEVTAALLKLQSGQKKKIYFLQGHGELDPDEMQPQDSINNVKQMLLDQQHDVEKLTLLGKTRTVPADASALVIAGARYPLRADETTAIQDYLTKGGHVLLLVGAAPKSPAFNDLLKPWGVKVGDDEVIDLTNTIVGTSIPALATYETHDITKDLRRVATAYPAARSVTPITPAPAGVTVSPLMKSSKDSWAETNLKATPKLDSADTPGPVTLGVAVTKDLSGPAPAGEKAGGKAGKIVRLVVIGSGEMAANNLTQALPGNAYLVAMAINWLAEEEALVNIPPKEEAPQNITLTDPQRRVISTTVYALPLAAMLLGGIVWWKRR